MLLAAATPVAASAAATGVAPVTTLAPDSEARWVPFELTPGNQIRFTMTLDGRTVTAILDTGVSVSVLAQRYATEQRLPVHAVGRADVIGGTLPVGRAETATLTIGGLTRRGGTVIVADLPAAATRAGLAGEATVDMLVGRDLTAAYALDIDYRTRRFRLLRSGRIPFAGATAPLVIAPDRQLYMSALTIGGVALKPVIVDTGDGAAVTLGAASWARTTLGPPATSTISYGLAGAVETGLTIVPRVALGNAVARCGGADRACGRLLRYDRGGGSDRIGLPATLSRAARPWRRTYAAQRNRRGGGRALHQRLAARLRRRSPARAARHAQQPGRGGGVEDGRDDLRGRWRPGDARLTRDPRWAMADRHGGPPRRADAVRRDPADPDAAGILLTRRRGRNGGSARRRPALPGDDRPAE